MATHGENVETSDRSLPNMYRCYTSGEPCHVPSLGNLGSVEVFLPMFLHVLSLLNVTLIDFNRVISWWFLELVYIENCHRSLFNFHELSNVDLKDVLWSVDPFMDSSWVSVEFRCPATQNVKIWVCLKIGYTPNYSHLVGIMIINHWV